MVPAVFLSPHFDDVALSCGGLAAARPGSLCLTLFAAPPPPGVPLSAFAQELHDRWGTSDLGAGNALRRAEERAATARLGLALALLDYPDAVYRPGRYESEAAIFGALDPAEADLPAALADDIAAALAAHGVGADVPVYAPLGLGHHVDHQLTYQAAGLLAARGRPVYYYEDFPYAARPGAHAARFAELGGAFTAHLVPIDATIAAKIAAIRAYASQISSLFPGADAVGPAVRAYAEAVVQGGPAPATPGTRFAERYWQAAGESGV